MTLSCIPLKIAPQIQHYKLMKTRRFIRQLPQQHAFVFQDTKVPDAFYQFFNIRFSSLSQWTNENLPINVKGASYFFSFYGVEKTTKTFNLFPFIVDTILEEKGDFRFFERFYTRYRPHAYIVITVRNETLEDCLEPRHPARESLVEFLEAMRKDYLMTNNYIDQLFRK